LGSIGPDLKPTYDEKPPDDEPCTKKTENVCTSTISYGVVEKRAEMTPAPTIYVEYPGHLVKRASTTATKTISFCSRITGCNVLPSDTTTTTTSATPTTYKPRVVYPVNPTAASIADIRQKLQGFAVPDRLALTQGMYESRGTLGTMFFYHPALSEDQTNQLKSLSNVSNSF
jgi:hypothetical protein